MFAIGVSPFVINNGVSVGDWGNGWLKTLDTLIDMDFANGRYFGAKVTDLVTSRAASALAPDASGVYQTFASNVPRILSGKGLLVEEARTNGIRNSSGAGAVAGTPGTLPTNWPAYSYGGLTGLNFDVFSVGTENGLPYVDFRLTGTPSGTGNVYIFPENRTAIVAATGETWTSSLFAKLVSGTASNIIVGWDECTTSGVFVSAKASSSTALSGTLTKFSYTATNSGGATVARNAPIIGFPVSSGVAIDRVLRIAAPQLELGAFATSPILTTSSALTRPADNIYLPISGIGMEYTVYCETAALASHVTDNTMFEIWSDASNRTRIVAQQSQIYGVPVVDGATQLDSIFAAATGAFRKMAMRVTATGLRTASAGTLGVNRTTSTPALAPTRVYMGSRSGAAGFMNEFLPRFAIIPRAMSDAELQALTT